MLALFSPGVWQLAEWRCGSVSLLLPKRHWLHQLFQLHDMPGTWRHKQSSRLPVWLCESKKLLSTLNVCSPQEPEDQEYFSQFVTLPAVRRAIHVGNLTFHDGSEVEKHLLQDVMKSIKPWLGVLMDNYRVSGWECLYCTIYSDLFGCIYSLVSLCPGLDLQWSAGCHCSCSSHWEVPAHCELDRRHWVQNSCTLPLESAALWYRGGRLCQTGQRVFPGEQILTTFDDNVRNPPVFTSVYFLSLVLFLRLSSGEEGTFCLTTNRRGPLIWSTDSSQHEASYETCSVETPLVKAPGTLKSILFIRDCWSKRLMIVTCYLNQHIHRFGSHLCSLSEVISGSGLWTAN